MPRGGGGVGASTGLMEQDFHFEVDLNKMKAAHANWNKVKDAYLRGIQLGRRELAERLIDKIRENLILYGLGDSSIGDSITVKFDTDGFYIDVGAGHAMYLEYGTGATGAGSPHERANAIGWDYSEDLEGWWYPSSPKDPNPTKKRAKDGGWVAYTKGHISRPFMYKSYRWASSSASQIIRKNVNRELKKVGSFLK